MLERVAWSGKEERNSMVIARDRNHGARTHEHARHASFVKTSPTDQFSLSRRKRRKIVDLVIELPRNPTLSYLSPTDELDKHLDTATHRDGRRTKTIANRRNGNGGKSWKSNLLTRDERFQSLSRLLPSINLRRPCQITVSLIPIIQLDAPLPPSLPLPS